MTEVTLQIEYGCIDMDILERAHSSKLVLFKTYW